MSDDLEHIIVINPGAFDAAAYEPFKSLPFVGSLTIIQGDGYGGRSKAVREVSAEEWAKATVLLTGTVLPPSPEAAPKLKYIQLFSAGSNVIVKKPFFQAENKVIYATASGVHGPVIAEYVILMMLTHFHQSLNYPVWQEQKIWGDDSIFPRRVIDQWGKTMGIFGYGAIGRQTARIAKSLGMKIVAYSFSNPPKKERVEIAVPGSGDPDGSIPDKWISGLENMDEFFSSHIDVLVISAPLTPETTKVINKKTLQMLKGAYIINIARGGLVDTDDLIEAAESGLIDGAALDVTDPEPLPQGHKLFSVKNIMVTPHLSGHVDAYEERVTNIAVHNIKQIREGKPVTNWLDKSKGY
ncbi:D-isomer-specific 2-hydroxyacid dehydrogenase-like protein [Myxozyma melibiosi]|uniref:D-isomer-specific 2-hydroxyacid dehydrogenase-like protein n=1 Tax=Myxozyma melibiosi TaxID=54550 RepID=A0ABR1EYA4_9ASCO